MSAEYGLADSEYLFWFFRFELRSPEQGKDIRHPSPFHYLLPHPSLCFFTILCTRASTVSDVCSSNSEEKYTLLLCQTLLQSSFILRRLGWAETLLFQPLFSYTSFSCFSISSTADCSRCIMAIFSKLPLLDFVVLRGQPFFTRPPQPVSFVVSSLRSD